MSANGCCWDNTVVESVFINLILKLDLDDNREALITPQPKQRDPGFSTEGYDNRTRRYSLIGYLSPIDYAQKFIAALTVTRLNP